MGSGAPAPFALEGFPTDDFCTDEAAGLADDLLADLLLAIRLLIPCVRSCRSLFPFGAMPVRHVNSFRPQKVDNDLFASYLKQVKV